MWRKPTQAMGAAAMILLAAGIVTAPTATAQEEPPTMPDITDMTLAEAQEAVTEASGDPELVLNTENIKGPQQEQLVQKWWKVCWQYPEADEPMDEEWYGVGVVRTYDECWS